MDILEELKSDLKIIKAKILIDLEDIKNVDYVDYYRHLAEEKVLNKYINLIEDGKNS